MKALTIVIIITFGLLLLSTAFVISTYSKSEGISEPNYEGLFTLGLIPSAERCSHGIDAYEQIGVIKQDINSYAVLKSKFGDETCLVKI